MLKVLIKDTGYITHVSEEYYDRYKDEGIELILIEKPEADLEPLNDIEKDIPEAAQEQPIEIKESAPKKQVRKRRSSK